LKNDLTNGFEVMSAVSSRLYVFLEDLPPIKLVGAF